MSQLSWFLVLAVTGYLCFAGQVAIGLLFSDLFTTKEALLIAFWPPAMYREVRSHRD